MTQLSGCRNSDPTRETLTQTATFLDRKMRDPMVRTRTKAIPITSNEGALREATAQPFASGCLRSMIKVLAEFRLITLDSLQGLD